MDNQTKQPPGQKGSGEPRASQGSSQPPKPRAQQAEEWRQALKKDLLQRYPGLTGPTGEFLVHQVANLLLNGLDLERMSAEAMCDPTQFTKVALDLVKVRVAEVGVIDKLLGVMKTLSDQHERAELLGVAGSVRATARAQAAGNKASRATMTFTPSRVQ